MNAFFNALEARAPDEAIRTGLPGYMDLIASGHRQVSQSSDGRSRTAALTV